MSLSVFPAVSGFANWQCPNSESYEYDIQVVSFRNKYEKRYIRCTSSQLKFEGELKYINDTDKATLLSFWDSMKGRGTAFYWYIPPYLPDLTGSTVTGRKLVRFDQEALSFECVYRGLYNVKIKLIEVQS